MHRHSRVLLAGVVAAFAVAPAVAQADRGGVPHKRVCSAPAAGNAACHAEVVTDAAGAPRATAAPASLGAFAISNSYGAAEFSGEASYESYYNHPNVTVSSGDSGYGVEFPAASRLVTAVGGTSLKRSSTTRGWTETAWSGAGSGCST